MNQFLKFTAIAASFVGFAIAAQASSQKVNGELAKFVDAYHQRKAQIRDINDDGIIEQACMDQVFQEWSTANLKMLDRTGNLDVDQIGQPLIDFGRAYVNSERVSLGFEYVAHGINQAIRDQREAAIKQHPNIPVLNPDAVSVDDWQEAAFLANTQLCLNRAVENAIKTSITIDFSAQIPPEITNYGQENLTWAASPRGGVDLVGAPIYGPTTNPTEVIATVVGATTAFGVATVIENRTFDLQNAAVSVRDFIDLIHSN